MQIAEKMLDKMQNVCYNAQSQRVFYIGHIT